ncbi:MAG: hypothetical protein OEW35_00585 [Gammaproteobacteria bacterium]|nr:hypothetical protein [Gammaproteobacteria bacterium]MDH4254772.1 hypothetical protein [Gammaproteobacteria bacterium]MDH5308316.1 hypothetical protein [Gammaproteobacteria bacterium]
MPTLMRKFLYVLLLWASVASSGSQDISQEQMRSLDEQVQEIKSDVLNIAAELGRLEERLLYPSNTQVAVFVALAGGDELRLDAVQVAINGDLVAHYIYSFKELEALQNGGVQRLYTGNVPTGEHQVSVSYNGKLKNGKDVSRSEQFVFVKGVEPKMLGFTLAGSEFGQNGIQFGDW